MAFNAVKNWIIWGTPILGHPIYVLLTCACLLVSAIVYRFVACLMFDVWRSYARNCPFHKHGHSAQILQVCCPVHLFNRHERSGLPAF